MIAYYYYCFRVLAILTELKQVIEPGHSRDGFVDFTRGLSAYRQCISNTKRGPFSSTERLELPGVLRG
ncbi:hypothetical protein L6452_33405 [Arctium lappa]|uniref:Uncharacterized protein n=1 Tax=Arctium lappa TaxID=4217 RepID=A0ACB8YFB9_ARCLA|nr:hypothetical protein L6452_33405 [Arctium lappa]